jgi:hypothetical protein
VGRFRAEAVIVKRVKDLTIVFYDKEHIFIKDSNHGWTVFHRWYAPLGSYNGGWRQFRHLLLYEKNITYNHCYRLAFRWEIQSMANVKEPDLSKFKIQERIN